MTKSAMNCRSCAAELCHRFIDLGMTPFSNAFLKREQLRSMETFYPLVAHVCDRCYLVQLEEFESPEYIFTDYAYFSSYSKSWLAHAQQYAEMAIARFGLSGSSRVIELASNDGYLLQFFQGKGVPVLGIEPAANVAQAAHEKGIPTESVFFGQRTAMDLVSRNLQADLLVANNVLAHVPDINDFVEGIRTVLSKDGVATIEFPHLMRLIEQNQFDTIYHEHFSYLSLTAVEPLFAKHGLRLFDVEELPTHGGSLRVYACHAETSGNPESSRLQYLRDIEQGFGMNDMAIYCDFSSRVLRLKLALVQLLGRIKIEGKLIVCYGAPAKGNTLLNYCGIGTDLIDYTVDRSPHKQGLFLPGTHIPIHEPELIFKTKPDYVLILPWNLRDEIITQMSGIRDWGGQFIVPVPDPQLVA